MIRSLALLTAVVGVAACEDRKPGRAQEAATKGLARPFKITRAQVALLTDPQTAMDLFPEPDSEAPDDESKAVLAKTIVEAWIATVEKPDRERAEKELAKAYVSVDTTCGSTPACAVDRVDAVLRGHPRKLTFQPIGKGDRVWMNVAVTDFEDSAIASAEIKARVDFSDDGSITIAELGVAIEKSGASAAMTARDEAAIAFMTDWLAPMWAEAPAPDLGLSALATHTEPSCDGSGPCVGTRLHEIMAAHPDLDIRVVTKKDLHGPVDVSGAVAARPNATYVVVDATGRNLAKSGMRYGRITAAVVTGDDGTPRVDAIQVETGYASPAEN